MALKPNVLASECAYIDDSEHVGFPWLDCSSKILAVIEKGSFGNWLCSSGIGHTYETLQENWHLLMIPIRDCENHLHVILAVVWGIGIIDDQSPAKPIRILPRIMRVIPVCPWLVNLQAYQYLCSLLTSTSIRGLAVKSYVNKFPGGIPHWLTPTGPSICVVPFM